MDPVEDFGPWHRCFAERPGWDLRRCRTLRNGGQECEYKPMIPVLIPCYRRPEFLRHVLDNILLAEEADLHHYIFKLDHGHDPEAEKMAQDFPLSKRIIRTPRTSYTIGKQSYNVLSGFAEAFKSATPYAILIEDDVIIGRDFFRWHKAVHEAHDLFSAHANMNVNSPSKVGLTDQYYLTSGDYGSIGVSLSRKAWDRIAPHVDHEYFAHPVAYVKKHFPASTIGHAFAEQDGLIRRIQMAQELPQAYPCHVEVDGNIYGPRCYHAGFVGKNRPQTSMHGDLSTRTSLVGRIIYDRTSMSVHTGGGSYAADSIPVALELPAWSTLTQRA